MAEPVQAALDELALYLRPPGLGIHAVSSGKREREEASARYLGGTIAASWREHLNGMRGLSGKDAVALLAIPSDAGAGIMRGAARGPEAIRAQLGTAPCFDLGDVFSVPHFIDDEMLSSSLLERARAEIYGELDPAARSHLPVSPVDMATRALRLVARINPELRVLTLGGDHTVSWPVMDALFPSEGAPHSEVGIVHFDAHTDLLATRLGVRYCFATWAYHANDRIGRGKRLLQIGIRASAKPQAHWESTLDVRQIWAAEANLIAPEALGRLVVDQLHAAGVRRVYITNDLDGTDRHWAAACGTPEPDGLSPGSVLAVIDALMAADFLPIGADVVELAPGLSLDKEAAQRSVETATRYTLKALDFLRRDR